MQSTSEECCCLPQWMLRFRFHTSCSIFSRNFFFARSFYDDCIIFSKRVDHIRHVKAILDKFAKFGIQINFKKCQFAKEEVDFLGYVFVKTV